MVQVLCWGMRLYNIYTLSTRYLHTIYTLSTHYLHYLHTDQEVLVDHGAGVVLGHEAGWVQDGEGGDGAGQQHAQHPGQRDPVNLDNYR